MASRSRTLSGMGYVGYPARIFLEMSMYGTEDTYEANRIHLHKWYSHLRAYLPEMYDKEYKREIYNTQIAPLLDEASDQMKIARGMYRSTFEGVQTWTEDEKNFQEALDGIFERLDVITAKTKVIDKEKLEDVEVIF